MPGSSFMDGKTKIKTPIRVSLFFASNRRFSALSHGLTAAAAVNWLVHLRSRCEMKQMCEHGRYPNFHGALRQRKFDGINEKRS